MTRIPFIDALARQVLVCDGAMGTMLYAKGVFLNRSFDELNLTRPELVLAVHQAYALAGADVIETNTFGANRVKLAPFGLGDRTVEINREGARLARQAARDQVYVAGAMGPLGVRIEPWGRIGVDEAQAYFSEQVAGLLEGGVDLFILETFHDVHEVAAAIRAVRSATDLPIVAQVATEEDGNTLDGAPPEAFVPLLEEAGATVVGVNCSVGPAGMLETIERMARVAHVPLSAQPNAGRPREIEGRHIYLSSPEYMASYARRFIASGVRLVGGCCGTTPEHVRHIKAAVRALSGPASPSAERVREVVRAAPQRVPASTAGGERSRLAHALARRAFVVAVELVPPRGHVADALTGQARQLRIHGVDFVNIPDGPRASARMSAIAAALVVQQAGLEVILHYACRDRNLLGMQSDLLGAHSMGVRNLLLVTGDPTRTGDYPEATSVFDVDSIGLTNVVARLNRGYDIGEQPIGAPTAFLVGVALNPTAPDVEEEIRRFRYKLEAGADFAITQPVFDAAAFAAFLRRIEDVRIPILAGIMPLDSLRHAEFMANEVPGVRLPAEIVERMRHAEEAGRAQAEGLAIARAIAAEVRPLVQGMQISTAAGASEAALQVIEAVGA
jgi:methionine synthase / methylenetetrahydrofolate reductase(NADPH)